MQESEIMEAVVEILHANIETRDEIKKSNLLLEDLDVDSLAVIQIAVALEDRFKIELEDLAEHEIVTVEDLVRAIKARI